MNKDIKILIPNMNNLFKKVGRGPVFLKVIFKDKSPISNALGNNLVGYNRCNSKI